MALSLPASENQHPTKDYYLKPMSKQKTTPAAHSMSEAQPAVKITSGRAATDATSVLENILTQDGQPSAVEGVAENTIAISEAVITEWSGTEGVLSDGRRVQLDASCLVSPALQDEVLVAAKDQDQCWLIAILNRTAKEEGLLISSPHEIALQAAHITFATPQMQVLAQESLSRVRDHYIVTEHKTETTELRIAQVGTDVRHAGTVTSWVSGIFFQQLGKWIITIANDARLKAKSFWFQ